MHKSLSSGGFFAFYPLNIDKRYFGLAQLRYYLDFFFSFDLLFKNSIGYFFQLKKNPQINWMEQLFRAKHLVVKINDSNFIMLILFIYLFIFKN